MKRTKKIIQLIPGLENAEIIRYGVMHKNNYINSPKILNEYLQTKKYCNLFLAGQLVGVEGYIESASSGIIAAMNLTNYLFQKPMKIFPCETIMGSLIYYITHSNKSNFQPMKANFGILPEVKNIKFKSKLTKHEYLSLQSQKILNLFLKAM